MKQNQHKKRAAGFTLVEAIVAVSILGMVSFMVFKSLLSVMGATKMGAEAADQVQRERVAIKTVETGLRGMVYYEQNDEMYALNMDITDPDYPYFSFVARVPPDFIGSREFNGQALRRLTFFVDDVDESRALVLEQSHVMRTPEGENPIAVIRSVLAPSLEDFLILFWSTSAESWIDTWEPEPENPMPTKVKVEMALTRQDGGDMQLKDIHKREVVIHSISITKANQNPDIPAAARGRSSSRGSSSRGSSSRDSGRSRYTPEQIAAWRKRQEQSRKSSGQRPPNSMSSRSGQSGSGSRGAFGGISSGFGAFQQGGSKPASPAAPQKSSSFAAPADNNASK